MESQVLDYVLELCDNSVFYGFVKNQGCSELVCIYKLFM